MTADAERLREAVERPLPLGDLVTGGHRTAIIGV
jgi:hypothetical protein